ncbi:hypothetical protein EVAR_22520_1 [Eumeta japonica]|uniref:Uncharacterized protein n=1 Tax=Eumeta variegata TaxID=151549 RepID=A0A4C1U8I4_EUMVA|nr:hypothetical protein EVAR_22520_1 [Eumeta japonica]
MVSKGIDPPACDEPERASRMIDHSIFVCLVRMARTRRVHNSKEDVSLTLGLADVPVGFAVLFIELLLLISYTERTRRWKGSENRSRNENYRKKPTIDSYVYEGAAAGGTL